MTGHATRWARLTATVLLAVGGLLLLGTGTATAAAGPAAVAATGTAAVATTGATGAIGVPANPLPDPDALETPVPPGSSPDAEADTPSAQTTDEPGTEGPGGPGGPQAPQVTVELDGLTDKPSTSVVVLLGLTLLSLVPAILLTCTSFTKVLVVLGLTRNALGLQQTPPNQVLAGLALFLSLFIMAPVLGQMNDQGVQPYLDGSKTQTQAFHDGIEPLREFMLAQTGDDELKLLTNVADRPMPDNPDDVPLTTLIPSFILSELKQAFIIGFIIFIPFLVIDIVVSAALMSLGMMMMPPVMVSLPFKLLLFVLVDGWGLIVKSLVSSYG